MLSQLCQTCLVLKSQRNTFSAYSYLTKDVKEPLIQLLTATIIDFVFHIGS